MSLRSRIAALEQQAKWLAIPDSCPTCGGPMPGVNRLMICDENGRPVDVYGNSIDQCPQCGLLVGKSGKALSSATAVPARGEVHVKRITLVHGPAYKPKARK
ncbi:MAG: hypothetical protein V3T84_17220 [Phycisphaerales bacterium]